ncbi:MAG TPA: Gfo/Idh/MocA family oxidoreductase [Verrucomicrobiales bacterium]|nr:Gfo/Idh/MocA family oxidoreductase [Verrucomicrobiales bacterium]
MSKTPSRTGRLANDLTRRRFLRNSAITATALSYSRIAARAAGAEASDALNVALVGCGQQGMAALNASMVKIPGLRMAAVCDIWDFKRLSSKRAIDSEGKIGTEDYSHIDEMLAKVKSLDCVVIATPDWLHAPYSRMALEAGKNVYCEKMMSNSIEAAADMVKAQRQTGKLLQIGHQRRSNPRYVFMRDKLLREKNLLGQITHLYGQWNRSVKQPLMPKISQKEMDKIKAAGYPNLLEFANWRWFKKFGGGPISDLGAHQIDIFNWILGTTPKALTASGGLDYYKNRPLPGGGEFSYEHLDNAILIYEYDVPGHGLVRVIYQVLTTTGSQNYYEKIMGVEGTIVISEQPVYNQVYREKDTTETKIGDWEKLVPLGYLRKPPATVYNKFWERPKMWNRPDPWLEKEGVQDVRVSVPADPYEIPAMPKYLDEKLPHQHHMENFFNTVRNGGKQTDLNCPVAEAYKCARAVLAINDAVAQQKRIEFKPGDFEVS